LGNSCDQVLHILAHELAHVQISGASNPLLPLSLRFPIEEDQWKRGKEEKREAVNEPRIPQNLVCEPRWNEGELARNGKSLILSSVATGGAAVMGTTYRGTRRDLTQL
jgi:hypothetical protein